MTDLAATSAGQKRPLDNAPVPDAKRPNPGCVGMNSLLNTVCQVKNAINFQSKVKEDREAGGYNVEISCSIDGQQYTAAFHNASKEVARDEASEQILMQIYRGESSQQIRDRIIAERAQRGNNRKQKPKTATGKFNIPAVTDFDTADSQVLLTCLVQSHNGSPPGMTVVGADGMGNTTVQVDCFVDTYTYTATGTGPSAPLARIQASENILHQMYPSYSMPQIRGFVKEEYTSWKAKQPEPAPAAAAAAPVQQTASTPVESGPPPTDPQPPCDQSMIPLLHTICQVYQTAPPTAQVKVEPNGAATVHLSVQFMGYTYQGSGSGLNKTDARARACGIILGQLYPEHSTAQIKESIQRDTAQRRAERQAVKGQQPGAPPQGGPPGGMPQGAPGGPAGGAPHGGHGHAGGGGGGGFRGRGRGRGRRGRGGRGGGGWHQHQHHHQHHQHQQHQMPMQMQQVPMQPQGMAPMAGQVAPQAPGQVM